MAISLADARRPAPARVGWSTNIPPEWEVDMDALRATLCALNFRNPVVLGPVEYPRGKWGGQYRYVRTGSGAQHRISLRRCESAAETGRTLWHELCHAHQQERGTRDPRGTTRLRGAAYRQHPNEIEARQWEARHDTHPLVRVAGAL